MTKFPSPIGGSGVDKNYYTKPPQSPKHKTHLPIEQTSSQSIKDKDVKLDPILSSKGSLHLLSDPSVNAAVASSIGSQILQSKPSLSVYKLKNGWFVKLKHVLSPVTWYKAIKSLLSSFKKKHPASVVATPHPSPKIATPKPAKKAKVKPATPPKKAKPKQPRKKPAPVTTTPAYDHLAETLAKGPIKSKELVAMVHQLHNDFLKVSQEPEAATALHVLEEKAAAKLEEACKFKEACEIRALAAQIPVFEDHPLADLDGPPFGTYCCNLDSGIVKGGNVHGIERSIDGKKSEDFTFKISHPARAQLELTLASIYKDPSALEMSAPKGFKDISVKKETFVFLGKDNAGVFSKKHGLDIHEPSVRITFKGKGDVIVGANAGCICLHNNIVVQVDPSVPKEERLQTAHAMVTMLGLGPVFGAQRLEDDERIKMAQLYRAYYPKDAYALERQPNFYTMPIEELKQMIETKTPAMKAKWAELDTMVEEEIYPGKKVWCVPTLADQMRKKGAMGLMSGVSDGSIENTADTICLILKDGALSSQDRYQIGLFKEGLSTADDFKTGGGDTVFTRLVTEQLEANRWGPYSQEGKIQILWDLDVVNRGCYGYKDDKYGTRGIDEDGDPTNAYQTRSNLIDLTGSLDGYLGTNNEVMVKNRIDPNYVRGLVVKDDGDKVVLVEKLKKAKLVDSKGLINGKLVDEFVHVADRFKKEMWD